MAHNDIYDMLDHLRMIKCGGDLNRVKIDQIVTLETELRFFRTFLKYHHVLSHDSLVKITKKAQLIVEMLQSVFDGNIDECKTNLNVERLVSHLFEFKEDNTSPRSNYELDHSYLSEYMDYLDKNLNDAGRYLVKSDPFLRKGIKILHKTDRFLKQVKIIQNKMRFLRYLYAKEINSYIDHEKLEGLETRIQFMADNVGQLCLALWLNEDGDDTTHIEGMPPYLLSLVVLVELEMKKIFLCELKASKFSQSRNFKDKKLPKGFSHHLYNLLVCLRKQKFKNFHSNVSARNIDVAIEFLLIFLGDVPNHVINGKRLNEVLKKVGALVGDTVFVIQNLLATSTIKDRIRKINLRLIQILEEVENLKAKVEEMYYISLEFTPSQFPTVGGLSFLDSLLRKLNEMLKSEVGSNFTLKPHIGILEKELSSLTSIFRDVAKVQHEHEILKDIQRRTINLAYEAEVAIDSILAQYKAHWHIFFSLPTILKQIKYISADVSKIWSENISRKHSFAVEPSNHTPSQHSNLADDEEIVGFENEAERIIQYLIQGTNELDVIPIIGMGGQGKTTIARMVYNKDIIVSHFDGLAWCVISQTYNRRELLQVLVSQVIDYNDTGDMDDVLAAMLRKSLIGKRYLIVLDDMWDVKAWDDFRLSFPNDKNRSRIIVTTRLEEVGRQVKHHTDPYSLPFLPLDESCKLLQKRVFQNEGCPPELQDASLAVAERCKGLPIVVILVAGIIKNKKMEEAWWHEVKSAMFSYVGEFEEYSHATMHLSYDNLPDYLRPCLLYMGMFPEDTRIPVSKLISLWIAEGFVQDIESGRSVEEAAEGYLMELISSNMVMVSRRRYNGKVKYCHVHDVVLHFCLKKSREEKFMLTVKGHPSQFQLLDWKENRLRFDITDELSEIALLGSKTQNPFHKHLRSLITTYGTYVGIFLDWNPFPHISKFRLLKVLDLSYNRVDRLSSSTLHPLIHLKYLAVSTFDFDFHPESHLRHLETIIVKGSGRVLLPAIFWKMEKLRHIECYTCFDLENNKQWIFEESSKLENLKTLRKVEFPIDDADCMEVLLRRCPNLQELEISIYSNEWYSAEICTSIPKLETLTQLQLLYLCFRGSNIIVSELHLPSNLKKLVLYGPHIVSTASLIAGLPSLEYLELMDWRRESEEWCLGDITFDKLKFLKLVDLGIKRWKATDASFPQLETLVLKGCHNLKKIPPPFADIQTLKQIKLIRCENLEASASEIKEQVKNIQGSDLVNLIIIKDRWGYLRTLFCHNNMATAARAEADWMDVSLSFLETF
uniref:Late blight resistance protein homolog R1A-3 n=1 Tax=Nicotiana tabacum TaxID=4097 RepID=A0A1S3X3W9_TOBAC|nr:PREDICTED: putative late blight resistance protein homolog R1A-3 [Nicotiana tabacum]